eukprot:COSAG02_NODE_2706_length_8192_cov_25.671197_8_plen_41_part_00
MITHLLWRCLTPLCMFRAIAAFTAAWFHPNEFAGVISHCG